MHSSRYKKNVSIMLLLLFTFSEHIACLLSCPVVLIVLIGTSLDEPYWIAPAKHTAGSSIQTALTLVSLKWTTAESRGGFLKYRRYKCTPFWYVHSKRKTNWSSHEIINVVQKVPIINITLYSSDSHHHHLLILRFLYTVCVIYNT